MKDKNIPTTGGHCTIMKILDFSKMVALRLQAVKTLILMQLKNDLHRNKGDEEERERGFFLSLSLFFFFNLGVENSQLFEECL